MQRPLQPPCAQPSRSRGKHAPTPPLPHHSTVTTARPSTSAVPSPASTLRSRRPPMSVSGTKPTAWARRGGARPPPSNPTSSRPPGPPPSIPEPTASPSSSAHPQMSTPPPSSASGTAPASRPPSSRSPCPPSTSPPWNCATCTPSPTAGISAAASRATTPP